MNSWEYSTNIDNGLPHYYYQEELIDFTSVYYKLESKVSSIFFQLHRFHLDFTESWQRIKLVCRKEQSTCFSPLFENSVPLEKEGMVTYLELLPEQKWKPKVEKILRVCDQIEFIPALSRSHLAFGLFIEKKKTFFDQKCYEVLSYEQLSIYTFKLVMCRWKNEKKIIVPRVIQDKILSSFSPINGGGHTFKEIYPILPRWRAQLSTQSGFQCLYVGNEENFIFVSLREVKRAQNSLVIFDLSIKKINADFFQNVFNSSNFEIFKANKKITLSLSEEDVKEKPCRQYLKKIIEVMREKLPVDFFIRKKLEIAERDL